MGSSNHLEMEDKVLKEATEASFRMLRLSSLGYEEGYSMHGQLLNWEVILSTSDYKILKESLEKTMFT